MIDSLLGTREIFELNDMGFVVAMITAVSLLRVAEDLSGKKAFR